MNRFFLYGLLALSALCLNVNTASATDPITSSILWSDKTCDNLISGDPQPQSGLLALVGKAILPKAIDFGFSYISEKLKKKSESFEVTYVARTVDQWGVAASQGEVVNHKFKKDCIVIYAGDGGKWKKNDSDEKSFYPVQLRTAPMKPSIMLMAEINYHQAGNRGALFNLALKRIAYNGNSSSGRGAKDVLTTFKFTVPKLIAGSDYSVSLNPPPLRGIKAGVRSILDGYSTDIAPTPIITIKQGEPNLQIAASLEVTVLETDKGQGAKLYKALGEIVTENKEDIKNKIILELTPKSEEETSAEN